MSRPNIGMDLLKKRSEFIVVSHHIFWKQHNLQLVTSFYVDKFAITHCFALYVTNVGKDDYFNGYARGKELNMEIFCRIYPLEQPYITNDSIPSLCWHI